MNGQGKDIVHIKNVGMHKVNPSNPSSDRKSVNGTGALVGFLTNAALSDSYAKEVEVHGTKVGGLIGVAINAKVERAYTSGGYGVHGGVHAGGLIGSLDGGATVIDSYSMVEVSARSHGGGLVGLLSQNSVSSGNQIMNSYSVGIVEINDVIGHIADNLGGLVGVVEDEEAMITHSYWDMETSGQAESAAGTGLMTDAMQNSASFPNYSADTWVFFEDAYPELQVFWKDGLGGLTVNPGDSFTNIPS